MKQYKFTHLRIECKPFVIHARRIYEAIEQLEAILGPEKLWIHEYYVTESGKQVSYGFAA